MHINFFGIFGKHIVEIKKKNRLHVVWLPYVVGI